MLGQEPARRLPRQAALRQSGDYRPPWWCRSGHLQTVWGPLFRRGGLAARRERLVTPDEDFLDLDWVEPASPSTTLLLVLHGLEGSSRSHYAVGLARGAIARGWRAAILNFRSCSGELNRARRFYHSGETGDLGEVVRRLLAREPRLALLVAGVSLGGNVLIKWLGERGEETPAQLAGAVAISTPFDLAPCTRALDSGVRRRIYTANFLRTMRAKVRAKAARDGGFANRVDVVAAARARTFAEYDRAVTAPLGGFTDELDYWQRASSAPWLARVRRPTLLINALDDPIVPPEALPDPRGLPRWVRAEFTPHGGHAGFLEGAWPWRLGSWAERRAVAFLAECLPAHTRIC